MIDYAKTRTIDCTEHVEKKGQFSYLSWAWALDALRMNCPNAQWEPVASPSGTLLHDAGDGETSLVMTRIFDGEISMPMWMPVLDYRNKPISKPNCFDVNTALMRCLTKNIGAYSGIGLHLYSGEDLPPGQERPAGKKYNSEFYKTVKDDFDKCDTVAELDAAAKALAPRANTEEDEKYLKTMYLKYKAAIKDEESTAQAAKNAN